MQIVPRRVDLRLRVPARRNLTQGIALAVTLVFLITSGCAGGWQGPKAAATLQKLTGVDLSAIKNYDEADLITSYEKDRGFLRFGILDSTMRFLFFAYHITVKRVAASGA